MALYVCSSCRKFIWYIESGQELVLFYTTGPSHKYKYAKKTNSTDMGSTHKLGFFCMLLFYINEESIVSIHIDPDTCPLVYWKLSLERMQTGHKVFLAPQSLGRSWQGFQLSVYNFHQSLIRYDLQRGVKGIWIGIDQIRVHW